MTVDHQTIAARALPLVRSFLRSFVDLFDLSAPARDYSVGMEEDITTAAWRATGRAMREAMEACKERDMTDNQTTGRTQQ